MKKQFSNWLEQLNKSVDRHFNSETEFLVADVIREACQKKMVLNNQQTTKLVEALVMNVKDVSDTAIKRRHENLSCKNYN
ncbi:MAG: hypothetical protein IPL22_14980 [Bacteroidetes bacterium]|nr:hypothetical protein [Bacteroidota bacterium]